MAGQPVGPSLFTRLLGNRASRQGKDGVKGQEEYLTQVMGFLLQRDHGLAHRWIRDWFGISDASDIEVRPEDSHDASEHPVPDSESSIIDLCVTFTDGQGERHRAYVENKVEAKLNQYANDRETIDQVDKYAQLLALVCAKRHERGHLVVCGLRPLLVTRRNLPPGLTWHEPKHWWDFTGVVQAHLDAEASGPDAAWVQFEFVKFCEEQGLVHPTALRLATATAEQARRLLGLAAMDAGMTAIRTTKTLDGDPRCPWTATVYFRPIAPRVTARPQYWVSLTQASQDSVIEARAYWERVGELGLIGLADFDGLPVDDQQRTLRGLIEGIPTRRDHLHPAVGKHPPEARPYVQALLDRAWTRSDVWVIPQGELRIAGEAFPKNFILKLTGYQIHGSEVIAALPPDDTARAHVIGLLTHHLGEPRRVTKTYRCYPIAADTAERVEAFIDGLAGSLGTNKDVT